MLSAGKRLQGDAAFDQEELQETLDNAESRWDELNETVHQYEVWLESSLQATQSYETSVKYIDSFLNDTEATLALGSSLTGDVGILKDHVGQLKVRVMAVERNFSHSINH